MINSKTKEAEVIKLNNMPAPESYRNWTNHVRDEVKKLFLSSR